MTQLGVDARRRKVKVISNLEHEMIKALSSLKQSLEVNSAFEGKMARAVANLEVAETRAAEMK